MPVLSLLCASTFDWSNGSVDALVATTMRRDIIYSVELGNRLQVSRVEVKVGHLRREDVSNGLTDVSEPGVDDLAVPTWLKPKQVDACLNVTKSVMVE